MTQAIQERCSHSMLRGFCVMPNCEHYDGALKPTRRIRLLSRSVIYTTDAKGESQPVEFCYFGPWR